mgnify:CR=1 FL=1
MAPHRATWPHRRLFILLALLALPALGWADPTLTELLLPQTIPGADPSWFGFLMTLREGAPVTRNQLAEHLEQNNIQTRNLFAGNLTRHPCFDDLEEGTDYRIVVPLTNTDRIMNDSLWVGVYPGMGIDRLGFLIETVKRFF